jgi:hypothetical protein
MPINQETLNRRLYKVLHNRFKDTKALDSEGDVSPIEDEADVFRFTFTKDGEEYGKVYVTVDNSKTLKIYYDDDVTDSPSSITPGSQYNDTWDGFTEFMKRWAMKNQLGWEPTDKDHLEGDMARRNHVKKQENMMEGYYPMGKKASYSDNVPNVKMVIQHTREIQEGEQRYRNVAKIFLENSEGERILAPTTKPGIARVYARHIAEGGVPNDERWNHIKGLCEEYSKMAGFVRATRGKQFNESAQGLIESGINHYNSLRESLSKLAGHRGYNMYFESWTPPLMEDEDDSSSITELFVQETMDPRIESVMPILSKLHKTVAEMKEVGALAEWADSLLEAPGAETLKHNQSTEEKNLKAFGLAEEELDEGAGGPEASEEPVQPIVSEDDLDEASDAYSIPESDNKKIEAHGVHGMKSKPWRKVFKNQTAFEAWLEKNEGNVEVHGTREVEEQVEEDLDANQKRVGQLGPTEKVGPKGAVGKLVGASESFINTDAQAVVTEEGSVDYGDLENEYYYVIDTQSGEVIDGPFDSVGEVPLRLMGFDGGHKVKKGAELKGLEEAKSDDPDYDKALKRFKKGLPPKEKQVAEGQEDLDAILRIIRK